MFLTFGLLVLPVPAGSSLVGPEEKFRAGVNLVLLFLHGWEGEGHTADGMGNKNNRRGAARSPSSIGPHWTGAKPVSPPNSGAGLGAGLKRGGGRSWV